MAVATAWGANVCSTKMTTAQFRRQARAQGYDLTGLDVDHAFPRSRGGVDHPWNYQLMESSLNRGLGNKLFTRFLTTPLPALVGRATTALARLGGC
jgi:hypothetical protein